MRVFQGTNPFDQLTPAVRGLVAANVAVFLALWMLPPEWVRYVGLLPVLVFKHGWVWQLLTYAFVHVNGWHLFFNVWALWLIGPHVESAWGTRAFLRFYFACALGAALAQSAVAPESFVVGASGAIYGVLLAFGLLYPDAVLYILFIFPMRALHAVIFLGLLSLAWAMGSGGSRIAHFAHLGGLATGYLYLKVPVWIGTLRSWRGRSARGGRVRFKVITPDGPADDLSREVDRILEKISLKGVGSLTADEHDIMRRYAERKH